MGDSLDSDVERVIRNGPWAAFFEVTSLRALPAYLALGDTDERSVGSERLIRTLQAGLKEWNRSSPSDAEVMSVLLHLDNRRGSRKLTGSDGVRAKAGKLLGVGADQFYRVHERALIRSFASFLEAWEFEVPDHRPMTTLTFDDLTRCASDLYRQLEAAFKPHLVITMSGPGSFAACYMMQFNPREVPVVMAVTFPNRGSKAATELGFAEAAHANEALHVSTSKWSVYLPGLVRHLPTYYRIALVDDRVLTGDTQKLVRSELEALGFDVRCAALFSGPDCGIDDLLVGRRIPGPFQMPWGTARGRT